MFIYLKQASPTAANIHNRWLSSQRLRSLRSPMMMVEPSSKRANIWGIFTACLCSPSSCSGKRQSRARGRLDGLAVKIRRFRSLRSLHQRLWMFALFEDVFSLAVKPQVPFASLSPPAVMDVRRRRRRFLEIDVHNMLVKVQPIIYMRDISSSFSMSSKAKRVSLTMMVVRHPFLKVL